jgi:methionyl-tRNA synthetase
MKPNINYDHFSQLDLRVGTVLDCVPKEGSQKLLRLTVDFGAEGTRNILSGLAQYFNPEDLKGKQFIFVFNLEPRKLMGEESQGMILCAEGNKPIPLKPKNKVKPGAAIS